MKYLVILIILACIAGVAYFSDAAFSREGLCIVDRAGVEWYLKVADSPKEREMGLMNQSKMCQTCGMVFVFPEKEPLSFWMKNTLIPLDIYFYDETGKLVDKVRNMRPEHETGNPMQYNSLPAKYAIEVNEGIGFGETPINLPLCSPIRNT